ncbi:MAG: YaaC family protein [Candidatus Nanopelagicaceae bacterium]|nr:YaaC family protein [Candidatus Nanopelagicaceae bacterium]
MSVAPRQIDGYMIVPPAKAGIHPDDIAEAPTEKIVWFKLRQFTDVPPFGKKLFLGSTSEKNRLFHQFRSFVLAGQAYWEAGSKTSGSPASLLYYYSVLNLAKAELLQTNPNDILSNSIHHGLSYKHAASSSIKSDYLEVGKGVFPLLFEKRTGVKIPLKTKIPVRNLLSLIPRYRVRS